uniref:BURP domain-containing protein 5 n=1 Tax=Anthurium amnicola TaxID=1678845 RepID=A0A1D1XWD0_9ARAE
MVDYATLVLRTHDVRAISSVAVKEGTAKKQMYVVASSPQVRIAGNKIVSCHPLIYPYAVFHCHDVPATTVSVVPLVGEDGAKMDAIAVCHTDTRPWLPNHLAFQMTKVKPGTVPICHFVEQGGVVWAPRP